jgi:hypothetical protein
MNRSVHIRIINTRPLLIYLGNLVVEVSTGQQYLYMWQSPSVY